MYYNVNHLLRQSFGVVRQLSGSFQAVIWQSLGKVVRQLSGSFQAVIWQSLGNLLCTQKCFHIPDIVLTFQPITSRLCTCDSSAVLWLLEQFCFFKIREFMGILYRFYADFTNLIQCNFTIQTQFFFSGSNIRVALLFFAKFMKETICWIMIF